MDKNVGRVDAIVRWLVVGILAVLARALSQHVLASFLAAALAIVVAATSLTRTCPIYQVLGITTLRSQRGKPRG